MAQFYLYQASPNTGSGRVIDGQVLAGRELPPTSEAGYQHPSCTWHLRAP